MKRFGGKSQWGKNMLKEFKEFAIKGNVVDMGVGIVIGAAFTSIVKSFVADIINPIIGVISGGVDFSNLFINLGEGDFASLAAAQEAGAPTINYGLFINAIISFLIVAWVLFMVIKGVNELKRKEEEAPAAPAEPPKSEVLLEEIRDLLAKR
jgi:large conductance mechanosensitive channel